MQRLTGKRPEAFLRQDMAVFHPGLVALVRAEVRLRVELALPLAGQDKVA